MRIIHDRIVRILDEFFYWLIRFILPRKRKRLRWFFNSDSAVCTGVILVSNRPLDLRRVVQGAHLIFTGYGHWFPNDPRGSGSTEIRKADLRDVSKIHFGRKRKQPPREELKSFFKAAEPKLEHRTLWFDRELRNAIAEGFRDTLKRHAYTVWACAILRNHTHLVVRTHKNRSEEIWTHFAEGAKQSLRAFAEVPQYHPIWSHRTYKVYLYSKYDIRTRISYVNENPHKEGLPPQHWDFITHYVEK